MLWPLMLWVSLVWPFNFYLNIAHHTVFCLDVILFASFNLVRLACLFMMLSCFDSNNNNKYHQVLMRATRLWLFPLKPQHSVSFPDFLILL